MPYSPLHCLRWEMNTRAGTKATLPRGNENPRKRRHRAEEKRSSETREAVNAERPRRSDSRTPCCARLSRGANRKIAAWIRSVYPRPVSREYRRSVAGDAGRRRERGGDRAER